MAHGATYDRTEHSEYSGIPRLISDIHQNPFLKGGKVRPVPSCTVTLTRVRAVSRVRRDTRAREKQEDITTIYTLDECSDALKATVCMNALTHVVSA